MSLYAASKPLPLLAQGALWVGARLLGARVLPGAREAWAPPIDADAFDELRGQWGALVESPACALAIYERLQTERRNLTLLVCAGRRSVLVQVRTNSGSFQLERMISGAAQGSALKTFRVPRIVGEGSAAGFHWLAHEAIAYRPHRPVRRPADAIFAEISELVESVVERPPDTPPHWSGAHGDLNPWNLRRARGQTWLIDWEDACWAPPGADAVYFRAVTAALRSGWVEPLVLDAAHREAAQHWARIVADRPASKGETTLRERLLRALGEPN